MTIYRINPGGLMIESSRIQLKKESQLEDWLSQSPWAIAEEALLIIGRQTTARVGREVRYPDLIALDQDGNLIIIELKKGRAPREVIAQTLEYAAWASELNESSIISIAESYLECSLTNEFLNYFEVEEMPNLGKKLRLFIASEEIPQSILNTCRFLRTKHSIDISCVSYTVYQDSENHILVNSTVLVGNEPIYNSASSSIKINSSPNTQSSWNGDTPVKEIIWRVINALSQGNKSFAFSPKTITNEIIKTYPQANKSTIRCQISADCVNHPSRHHWPGGYDRYWQIGKGKYRIYNKDTDKMS